MTQDHQPPPAHPATGAMEERAKALAEMPSPKMQTCLAPEWYVKHYKTIRTALTTPITQPSAGDVEKVREALEMMFRHIERGDLVYDYNDGGEKGDFMGNAVLLSDEERTLALQSLTILDTLFPKVGA